MDKKIIILVGPTASGKTTVERALASRWGLARIIGHTTRPPREGELNGVDYHFVSEKEMIDLVESGQMLETNVFLGNTYGTSKIAVEAALSDVNAPSAVVVLDPNGLASFAAEYPDKVFACYFHHDIYVLTHRYMERIRHSLKDHNPAGTFCGFSNEQQLERYITLIHSHREWIKAACYDCVLDERILSQDPDSIADEIIKSAIIMS